MEEEGGEDWKGGRMAIRLFLPARFTIGLLLPMMVCTKNLFCRIMEENALGLEPTIQRRRLPYLESDSHDAAVLY